MKRSTIFYAALILCLLSGLLTVFLVYRYNTVLQERRNQAQTFGQQQATVLQQRLNENFTAQKAQVDAILLRVKFHRHPRRRTGEAHALEAAVLRRVGAPARHARAVKLSVARMEAPRLHARVERAADAQPRALPAAVHLLAHHEECTAAAGGGGGSSAMVEVVF